MVDTRDTTVTSGRARTAGNGIVVTGDRATGRLSARRHSRLVKILKIALPATAVVTVALFTTSVMKTIGWGDAIAELKIPAILPENLKMDNPHYEGYNTDGGRYWVKAESAQQDLKALTVIQLDKITGELTDANKQQTQFNAARGTFDSKANVLELYDSIHIDGDSGLKAQLTRATVMTKDGVIKSTAPVAISMPTGDITANQMTIRQKAKEYTFVDTVRAILKPKDQPPAQAAQPAPADQKSPFAFGASGQPIEVKSNRLDVNDTAKNAIFTGEVIAAQGEATLTTPELTVTYEGGETNKKSPAENLGDGKVKRIVASDPVLLKQGNGDTVTGRSAEFDATTQTAVLQGDIEMLQPPDKRAVGERVTFDQVSDTFVLTGAVAVTQGGNELKGRRLEFNRATGRMQLTAVSDTGARGRITARFHQGAAAGNATEKQSRSKDGISFGATFKTDPNAPVNIEADRLDVDDTAKRAVFVGNVRAVQGDFDMRAAELTASYSGSAGLGGNGGENAKASAAQLSKIVARKKVKISSKDGQNATGDWAELDTKANVATIGGDVILTQGKNVVRGTKLIIDMNTGESTIKTEPGQGGGSMVSSSDGDGDGQIVRSNRPSAVFYPSEMKTQGTKNKNRRKDADGWQARSQP